ncbi:hypothetical protein [Embleya sp. NPDC059237]|uniref:hypothetical protein n=1 Tax=Embleya sp. NPDC059237 TaxID=3346784 RepID=UPI00367D9BFF
MNHSIETRPDDLAQVRAASIMQSLVCQRADLPRLTWSVDPAGHVVGTRTAGPDADVAADLGAWAGALDATVLATPHRCDGRIVYRGRIDLTGSGRIEPGAGPTPVTITGVGVLNGVDRRPVARLFAADGLTRAQLDGVACVLCGVEPRVSTPVGRIDGGGQAFACAPACAPVVPGTRVCGQCVGDPQPDPTDPAEDDEPQPHPAWAETGDARWKRTVAGVTWIAEGFDEGSVWLGSNLAGLYLIGPGEFATGRWVGADLTAGLLAADRAISEWAADLAAAIGRAAGGR